MNSSGSPQRSRSSVGLSSGVKYPSAPKGLPDNRISIEAEKKNKLNTRVTPFIRQFHQTATQTRNKSQALKIADNLYNRGSLPRAQSAVKNESVVVEADPEQSQVMAQSKMVDSAVISKLNYKTNAVPTYNIFIRDLEKEKDKLEKKIHDLKVKIGIETKNISALKHSQSRYTNMIEDNRDNINKRRAEIDRTVYNSAIVDKQCQKLQKQLDAANRQNDQTRDLKNKEARVVQQLSDFTIVTKQNLLREDKQLNDLKANLSVALKSMNNNSAMIKYLESQRATVLLYISKQTEINRIKV